MTEGGALHSAAKAAAAVFVGWSAVRQRPASPDDGERTAARDHDEAGRGRVADRPGAIPLAGWKDILWRVSGQAGKDRVLLIAAGVTFYVLLALFPALTALVSIYGIFSDPQTVVDHIDAMSAFLPAGAMDIIGGQMERIAEQPAGRLNVGFIGGIAITLWSANNGMKALFEATNVAYNEKEKRGFIRRNAVTLLFTLATMAVLMLTVSMVVVAPFILGFVGLDGWAGAIVRYARWPLLFFVIIGGIILVYRFGPSRKSAQWRWVMPGAVAAASGWLITSLLFSWYVANFDSYNQTYGALGAVIAFMVWIWASATIIIMGAELNAETERQTRLDTTTGHATPMGARQAQVADTLGRRIGE